MTSDAPITLGLWDRLAGRTLAEVDVELDLEQTPDSFHAYAIPEGIEINAGDTVFMHDAPSGIGWNQRATMTCRATVIRAGWLDRALTEFGAVFALTELYHVGFDPRENAA